MNLRDRFRYVAAAVTGKSMGLPQHGISGSNGTNAGGSFFEVWQGDKIVNSYRTKTSGNFDDAYRKNALVFSCINSLVLSTTEAPLKDWDDEGGVIDSPVRELLKQPNTEQGEVDFLTSVIVYAALGGNCAIHKLRNAKGAVVGMVPYPITRLRPVSVKRSANWIEYYEYVIDGYVEQRIDPADVILFRWWGQDPARPWLGQPPLLAASDDVDTDEALTDFIKTVLENGAVVPTVFSTSGEVRISIEQLETMKADVEEGFTGANRGKPMFLPGGVTATKLGLDLKELSVDKLRNVPESRICGAFRVPPIIAYANMGMENSTYSNLDGFKRSFTQDTISPLWVRIADTFERGLRDEFKQPISLHFDTRRIAALQENQNEVEARAVTSYEKGVRTKNEARALLDLDELPGADVFADGTRADGTKPEPPQPEPMQSEPVAQPDPVEEPQPAEAAKAHSASFKAAAVRGQGAFNEKVATAHFKAYDKLSQAGADAVADKLKDAFTALEKKLLSGIKESKGAEKKELDVADILAFWDEDFFTKLLEDAATEPTQELVATMFEAAAANIKQDWGEIESEFDKKQKRVLQLSIAKIKETDATTRAQLQGLLEGMANAKVDDIRTVIKSKFDQYRDSKVNAIARTTATFATGAAQTDVWGEFGFEHEWLTQRDGKARQTHTAVDGDRPDEDGYFNVGRDKMKFPASGSVAGENVNCRCTLIPVAVEEEKRYALAWDGREVKSYLCDALRTPGRPSFIESLPEIPNMRKLMKDALSGGGESGQRWEGVSQSGELVVKNKDNS